MFGFGSLGNLSVVLTAQNAQFIAKMNEAEQHMKRVSKTFGEMGRNMFISGMRISLAVGIPAKLLARSMVRDFAKFDDQMAKSLSIMGDLSDFMKGEMRAAAQDMSVKWNMASEDVAEAYFRLGSAGLDAQQSLASLEPIVRYAKAGQFDLAEAVTLSMDAMFSMKMAAKDPAVFLKNLTRVTDVLVGANTLANASTQEFSHALTNQAAAVGRLNGMDIEQIVAVLAAMARQGYKGREAGMRFALAVDAMSKAMLKNSAIWEGKYNVHLYDAAGNARNLAFVIRDLERALDGLSPKQKEVALQEMGFNVRTKRTIKTLLGFSDTVRELEGRLRDMGGMTERVAGKAMESFAQKVGRNIQQLKRAGREIAESFAPQMEMAADKVGELAKKISDLPTEKKAIIAKGILGAATLGPTMSIMGIMAIMGEKLWRIMSKIPLVFERMAQIKPFGKFLYFFPKVVAEIMAIYTAIKTMRWAWRENAREFPETTGKIVGFAKKIGDAFMDAAGSVTKIRKNLDLLGIMASYWAKGIQISWSNLFAEMMIDFAPDMQYAAVKAGNWMLKPLSKLGAWMGFRIAPALTNLQTNAKNTAITFENLWRTITGKSKLQLEKFPEIDWGKTEKGTREDIDRYFQERLRKAREHLEKNSRYNVTEEFQREMDELFKWYDEMLKKWLDKWEKPEKKIGEVGETVIADLDRQFRSLFDATQQSAKGVNDVAEAVEQLLETGIGVEDYWKKFQDWAFYGFGGKFEKKSKKEEAEEDMEESTEAEERKMKRLIELADQYAEHLGFAIDAEDLLGTKELHYGTVDKKVTPIEPGRVLPKLGLGIPEQFEDLKPKGARFTLSGVDTLELDVPKSYSPSIEANTVSIEGDAVLKDPKKLSDALSLPRYWTGGEKGLEGRVLWAGSTERWGQRDMEGGNLELGARVPPKPGLQMGNITTGAGSHPSIFGDLDFLIPHLEKYSELAKEASGGFGNWDNRVPTEAYAKNYKKVDRVVDQAWSTFSLSIGPALSWLGGKIGGVMRATGKAISTKPPVIDRAGAVPKEMYQELTTLGKAVEQNKKWMDTAKTPDEKKMASEWFDLSLRNYRQFEKRIDEMEYRGGQPAAPAMEQAPLKPDFDKVNKTLEEGIEIKPDNPTSSLLKNMNTVLTKILAALNRPEDAIFA